MELKYKTNEQMFEKALHISNRNNTTKHKLNFVVAVAYNKIFLWNKYNNKYSYAIFKKNSKVELERMLEIILYDIEREKDLV